MSANESAPLRAALEIVPPQTLVVIWPGEDFQFLEETFPHPLQTPFDKEDLYGRGNIVADPILCGAQSEWWKVTRSAISTKVSGPPDEMLEILLLSWDVRTSSLKQERHNVSKKLLRTCVTRSLGSPLEQAEPRDAESGKVVEALASCTGGL